jgi:hypothetical protein
MPQLLSKKALQADVFDLLELKALEFGGVGGGTDFDWDGNPVCAFGLVLDGVSDTEDSDAAILVTETLHSAGIARVVSDGAVESIRTDLGLPFGSRVPFEAWCEELGVVRGDS